MAGVRQVAVVTESVACLPEAEAESLGVTVISIPFEYAGKEYLDGVDITPEQFNRMLSVDLPPAKTSAPSPGAYLEAFRGLGDRGYEVLCISPTREVTRMWEAADQGRLLAREEGMKTRIEVVDSGTATMAQGFLVLEAARMAKEGAGMDDILERVRVLHGRVYLIVALDTLDYLARTSRIPSIGALFGKVLRIKPVVLVAQGRIKPLEHPRSRRKSIRRLLDLTEERLQGKLPLRVAVQHANAGEEAAELKGMVARRFDPEEILIAEFSPVMSSYTGPGLLGLAFYEEPDGSVSYDRDHAG